MDYLKFYAFVSKANDLSNEYFFEEYKIYDKYRNEHLKHHDFIEKSRQKMLSNFSKLISENEQLLAELKLVLHEKVENLTQTNWKLKEEIDSILIEIKPFRFVPFFHNIYNEYYEKAEKKGRPVKLFRLEHGKIFKYSKSHNAYVFEKHKRKDFNIGILNIISHYEFG